MRRIAPLLLVISSLAASACSQTPAGPSRPASQDSLTGAEARIQATVRAAAIRFVEAYANAPEDGGAALDRLVTTPLMHDWVHWVGVQNREFDGAISGTPGVTSVGPAELVRFDQGTFPGDEAREVTVSAAIELTVTPEGEAPGVATRVLEGPMRLLAGEDGLWRVSDFSREGIPLSSIFQVMDGVRFEAGNRMTIQIHSFVAVPVWQFHLVVQVGSGEPVSLAATDASLLGAQGEILDAGTVTRSLGSVESGAAVEGIVAFEAQPSADDVTLWLDLASDPEIPPLEIPLADLITPIATAPVAGPGSATPQPPATASP